MSEARLWYNARVFTGHRYAEALLVEDGRVTAAGSLERVRGATPTGAEAVDLGGRLILPGLIDAHLHVADLTRAREGLELGSAVSVKDLVASVREWAITHPSGALVGRGWDAERLGRRSWPTCEELDEALAGRPLVLYHASGHAAVVNSAALRAAGIDRTTPDPPGGRIGRSPDGTPDGSLYEEAIRSVSSLATAAYPPEPTAIARTLQFVASLGLTTVVAMSVGVEEARALRELGDRNGLPVRVRMYFRLSRLGEYVPTDFGGDGARGRWAVTGVKGFTDGAFGPRTAWLSAPYADAPEEVGLPSGSDRELSECLSGAVARGLAPALHAIGDRAVERALRLLGPLARTTVALPRIEHAALTPPELFPLLDRVRPALAVQPGFVWSDSWLGHRLGRERSRWAYAFRTLSDRGHLLAGSSDAPYDPVDPWRGLAATVRRRDPEGRSANPDPGEALPLEEAFQLYTVNGGRLLGEPELGTLEPGARGDLIVLDTSDLSRAVARGSLTVRETWVEGHQLSLEDPPGSR
jgi:predicted amidohydrolase YtcJ